MKAKKAPGPDKITNEAIKELSNAILKHII